VSGRAAQRPRWGQNFLADTEVARRIVDWAGLERKSVVEVGPGRGALTCFIAERAEALTLLEIDPGLCAGLRERYAGSPKVEVVEADAVAFDWKSLAPPPRYVIGNLPYESGTAIVTAIVESRSPVVELVVMLQKEVVERLTARPGTRAYGLLTVMTQQLADTEAGFLVPPEAFRPKPKVESQLVKLRPLSEPRFALEDPRVFRELVVRAFGGKRKMVRNTLGRLIDKRLGDGAADAAFEDAGIAATSRPETVGLEEFSRLANFVATKRSVGA
jgi:16S rRNA (adenine1518-N6/adenine1519-N6)-dimethyltransferase